MPARKLTSSATLWKAAYNGDDAEIKRLLAAGIHVNRENSFGECPLHLAASRGHVACVAILLQSGALVDCRDAKRRTPMMLACEKSHMDAARMLLEHGADVDALDSLHRSPRSEAEKSSSLVLKALISHQNDVVPAVGGAGGFVLRRVEGLSARQRQAEHSREARIDAQGTGSHYPKDAPSQVAAMDISALRRDRMRQDSRRLSQPLWHWSHRDIALWLVLQLDHNLPHQRPEELKGKQPISSVSGTISDASAGVTQGGDEAASGPGEVANHGSLTTPGISRGVGNVHDGAGTGDADDGGGAPGPGLGGLPGWSTLEPVLDGPVSAAFVPWLAWFEAAGVGGRQISQLCNHPRPEAAVGWLLACAGVGPVYRQVAATRLLDLAVSDGSLSTAKALGCLPVAVVEDVLSASATLAFVGEVPVGLSDVLLHVRGRLVGGLSGTMDGLGRIAERPAKGSPDVQIGADEDEGRQEQPKSMDVHGEYEGVSASSPAKESVAAESSKVECELTPRLPPPFGPGFAFLSCASSRPVDAALEGVTSAVATCFGVLVLRSHAVDAVRLPIRPGTEPGKRRF